MSHARIRDVELFLLLSMEACYPEVSLVNE